MVWLKFAACLAIILFSGTSLARYGDAIAEKTGLGRMWVGLILLAAITSMPELVTGVSAVTLVKLPDLALGNLLGSCLFNLVILAVLDIMSRPRPVLSRVGPGHVLSAVFGIALAGVVVAGVWGGTRFPGSTVGWVSAPGIVPLVLYVVAIWWLFRRERSRQALQTGVPVAQYQDLSLRKTYLRFGLAAAAVIGAGIWLSLVGDEMVTTYAWDASFVGSLFVAITTSLPELVVSIAALRLGAVDMAVADVLGSNMFNLALITPVDLAYREGPVLSSVSGANLMTAVLIIVMSLVVISGLKMRREIKTFRFISWQSVALIGLYIFGMRYLFLAGAALG